MPQPYELSAAELARDIRRYLAHEPIEARPPSVVYQVRMFARRHSALFAAATTVVRSAPNPGHWVAC